MMTSAFNVIKQFLASEDGPTALEYAVMVSLIIIGCMLAISGFGFALRDWFSGATPTLSALRTAP